MVAVEFMVVRDGKICVSTEVRKETRKGENDEEWQAYVTNRVSCSTHDVVDYELYVWTPTALARPSCHDDEHACLFSDANDE